MRKRLIDYLVYLLVRVVVCLIQAMRIETCQAASRRLAYVASDIVGLRRRVVEQNLRLVYPDATERQLRSLSRRMWEHLLLMVCEIAHVPRKIHETNWRDYVSVRDLRRVTRYLLDERPSVLVSAHFGNFEVAGYVTGLLGFPTYTIARPLDNPFLDRFVNRFRAAQGQHILPKQGSASDVQRVLEAGGLITLLGDQHAGRKGCWVDFFGKPASCHKAISLFTLRSDAPMLVVYGKRRSHPLQFEVGLVDVMDPDATRDGGPRPELEDVKSLTQWYNRKLEEIILTAPEQYWWVHRRWKDGPPGVGRPNPARPAESAA